MSADLDWSRSTIVAGSSIAAITSSFSAPFLGRIVDKRGPRLVLVTSVVVLGLALIATSQVQEPWQFYVALGVICGISRSALTSVGPGAMVAQWFRRRRATAYSITAMGPPVGNVLLPPLLAVFIGAFGWRAGWMGLAALALGLGPIPLAMIVRRRPEDIGLRTDGDAPVETPADGSMPSPDVIVDDEDWTASEALHSGAFWMVAAGMALILLSPNVSMVFMYPYLTSKGLDPTGAAAAVVVVSAMQVISRLAFWGPAITRLGTVRRVVLLWGVLLLSATLLLAFAQSVVWAYVAAVVLGLGFGGNLVLQLQIWPEYFGRTAVGTITGMSQALQGLSSATVPLLLAGLVDRTGSYTVLFFIVSGLVLSGLTLHAMVGKPRRPARSSAPS